MAIGDETKKEKLEPQVKSVDMVSDLKHLDTLTDNEEE